MFRAKPKAQGPVHWNSRWRQGIIGDICDVYIPSLCVNLGDRVKGAWVLVDCEPPLGATCGTTRSPEVSGD
jgi:hypothetical protein